MVIGFVSVFYYYQGIIIIIIIIIIITIVIQTDPCLTVLAVKTIDIKI